MKKRFSIKVKLLAIFVPLIILSLCLLGFSASYISRKAVTEKIEAHLIDKANDIATIIDSSAASIFQFLEGVARSPILHSPHISYQEKNSLLKKRNSL